MSDYAKGFKDGFAAGLEEGKKLLEEKWRLDKIAELEKTLPKPQPRLDDFIFGAKETCPKCGIKISGVMGYVCASPNCPMFRNVTCGPTMADVAIPMTGAVGMSTSNPTARIDVRGANGAAGPYDGPEYAGKVYINGEWAQLDS